MLSSVAANTVADKENHQPSGAPPFPSSSPPSSVSIAPGTSRLLLPQKSRSVASASHATPRRMPLISVAPLPQLMSRNVPVSLGNHGAPLSLAKDVPTLTTQPATTAPTVSTLQPLPAPSMPAPPFPTLSIGGPGSALPTPVTLSTPASNKRPLSSLFTGGALGKKLGGKAQRVSKESLEKDPGDDEDDVPPPQPPQPQPPQQGAIPLAMPIAAAANPAPDSNAVPASAPPSTVPTLITLTAAPAPPVALPTAVTAAPASIPPFPTASAATLTTALPTAVTHSRPGAISESQTSTARSHQPPQQQQHAPPPFPQPLQQPLSHPPPPPSHAALSPHLPVAQAASSPAAVAPLHHRSTALVPAQQQCYSIVRTPIRTGGGSELRFSFRGAEYKAVGTLGKGGSGTVYRVEGPPIDGNGVDGVRNARYALKEIELPAAFGDGAHEGGAAPNAHVAQYATEVQTMLAMRGSQFVVQLHEAVLDLSSEACTRAATGEGGEDTETGGRFYMLMELGARDLQQHLDRVKLNPWASDLSGSAQPTDSILLAEIHARRYWRAMLRCVEAIHARGIIHTDLKPANFVLVPPDEKLKLIDFGIAKPLGVEATSAVLESMVGTPNYMSPESLELTFPVKKWSDGNVRPSSDIWTLGVILYGWIYGSLPFSRWAKLGDKVAAIVAPEEEPKYRIQFHERVSVVEKLASADKPQKSDAIFCALDEKRCEVTKVYARCPVHLVGVELPKTTVRQVHSDAIAVLRACLQRHPERRPSAVQLLQHPFVRAAGGMGSSGAGMTAGDVEENRQLREQLARVKAENEQLRQKVAHLSQVRDAEAQRSSGMTSHVTNMQITAD